MSAADERPVRRPVVRADAASAATLDAGSDLAPDARPRLSVVVPSFQRASSLARVLEALAGQDAPRGSFETVVVLDGSTDDSQALLEAWVRDGRLPGLRWHWQPNAGQSAARDAGVRLAAAPVVLLVDDDVIPSPSLVARHLAWHAAGERIAVLGDCEIALDGAPPDATPSFYVQFVRAWWEDMYRTRALAGRVSAFRDFCAGNVSLRRDDYLGVGGFDRAFRGYGGEDYELGYRLLRAGVRFVPDRAAHAEHHHRQSVDAALRGAREEGIADVYLGAKHPELRGALRLMHLPTAGLNARLVRVAFAAPRLDRPIARVGARLLALAERLRLRGTWQALHMGLRAHAYWAGVRAALGTREAIAEYQRGAALPEWTVEIARGLPPLDALADAWPHGPSRVHLTWHGEPFASIRLDQGPDGPLREHLARWIVWRLPGLPMLSSLEAGGSPFTVAAQPASAS